MIEIRNLNSVRIINLNNGVTNAIHFDLVDTLKRALNDAKCDNGIGALVLSSANEKFFSIGFDLPRLHKYSREKFGKFYREFNNLCSELYTFPKPTVAALTGHAIAGGCILALCCDSRVIAGGRKLMGLNEIKLGVPVPYLIDRILRSLNGDRVARLVMEGGEFFPPDRLLEMGMVDQVASQSEVVDAADQKARSLGSMPRRAFAMIKKNRVEPVIRDFEKKRDEDEENFLECWFSEEARILLKKAGEKF